MFGLERYSTLWLHFWSEGTTEMDGRGRSRVGYVPATPLPDDGRRGSVIGTPSARMSARSPELQQARSDPQGSARERGAPGTRSAARASRGPGRALRALRGSR